MSLISCLDLKSLISCLDLMSLITCHSSHISSLFHSSHVSSLFVSCLIFTSLILSYCLYTLGWPDLTSAHDLCPLVTAQYYRWPLPTPSAVTYAPPQRPSAQNDRNRVFRVSLTHHSLDLMSLISCLIITSLSLASRDKKRVKQRVHHKVQKREFTESIGSESVNHMKLITYHSSHVTHLMSHHYNTQPSLKG